MSEGNKKVKAWTEEVIIPTYLPALPDKNPMFLEKRVYQGSSGKVYPLPFTDRISETRTDRRWQAIYLENEFLQVMILPEIGGRIHAILDKTNNYDLIYRQEVIKPALVGLAGSWISGGIEFNWAQHHRPATFLPVDFKIEEHADGAVTAWLGDHEPMARMKGMHGVCLYPEKAIVELKARVYNRTPLTQTFLWWANVATKVHEGYQSFFPPDVSFVADHAKRAMSEYPLCKSFYYGVNYGERAQNGVPVEEVPEKFIPPHLSRKKIRNQKSKFKMRDYAPNDLSWYANIPVPTSYMCIGSDEDFFGGYDYFAEAGIVHIADHHIAPGKKQWTWGNHEFGYAWDRNLSDDEAPYIELMAGVFTDNQPDFSFLSPYETKTWSQYWYPIREIGSPVHANLKAALNVKVAGKLIIGVSVTSAFENAKIVFESGAIRIEQTANLSPNQSFIAEIETETDFIKPDYKLSVFNRDGNELISYSPKIKANPEIPQAATEPLLPEEIESVEELFLTGLHLEQYSHATRKPEAYWLEALKHDEFDSRSNNALGLFHLRCGEFKTAEQFFRNSIERLTLRNPNPSDGEAFYNLGLCLRFSLDSEFQNAVQNSKFEEAYAAFYKATWNQAQAGAGFLALAELDCCRKEWLRALEHLNQSLRLNTENLWARDLKVLVLREINRSDEAEEFLSETLKLDTLDWAARFLNGEAISCDAQIKLDIAHDFSRAGFYAEAIKVLQDINSPDNSDLQTQNFGTSPLVFYTLSWLYEKLGELEKSLKFYQQAANESPDYCFPHRFEEISILESAMRTNPRDSFAPYYLGNLFYDRRRYDEAISLWERSSELNPQFSIAWRNLGIAYFNVSKDVERAREAYDKAFAANSDDARLLYERDQLWKRMSERPENRLRELEKHPHITNKRDDLIVELCDLYNQTAQSEKALKLLEVRNFQPWEGGEGQALGQHTRTHLALGRIAFKGKDFETARKHFKAALSSPGNLGEAKHLLANQSNVYYWLGLVESETGNKSQAQYFWQKAANFKGDFQEMSVREFSEMTYYSALSLQKLGKPDEAEDLFRSLLAYAEKLQKSEAKIDYFATSLPTMLIFEDDIQARQKTTAIFLQAQAYLGLSEKIMAKEFLRETLRRDPNHALAADLLETNFEKSYEKFSG